MRQPRSRTLKGMRLAAFAALGATALAAAPAFANPVVTSWSVDTTSQFDTGATQFTKNTNCRRDGTHFQNITSTTSLAWGCPSNSDNKQSSLILNPATGSTTATTYIGSGAVPNAYVADPGIILTHNNFVVGGKHSGTLTNTALDNSVTLTPLTPTSGSALAPEPLNFGIKFKETNNNPGRHHSCAVGGQPCADIFVFDKDSLNHSFTYDDNDYFLSLFPVGGNSLSELSQHEWNRACHTAGAENGCFGFWTAEGKSNDLTLGLTISTEKITGGGGGPGLPVPEPNALGLMGFGLLSLVGLIVLRRRRIGLDSAD